MELQKGREASVYGIQTNIPWGTQGMPQNLQLLYVHGRSFPQKTLFEPLKIFFNDHPLSFLIVLQDFLPKVQQQCNFEGCYIDPVVMNTAEVKALLVSL